MQFGYYGVEGFLTVAADKGVCLRMVGSSGGDDLDVLHCHQLLKHGESVGDHTVG